LKIKPKFPELQCEKNTTESKKDSKIFREMCRAISLLPKISIQPDFSGSLVSPEN
jgi:hypothetical protein